MLRPGHSNRWSCDCFAVSLTIDWLTFYIDKSDGDNRKKSIVMWIFYSKDYGLAELSPRSSCVVDIAF